ncbi:phage portal protein [Zhongshania marina]|uniref:Phage portal protein n=1 Tax=Zhongshania marina TaxID=2304603 RepID=A0A2S4HGG8_9GAMM|nr:phage portal protein [Marortus luteolus]POP53073.1 phage portal protein [Marortus luteolus]
MSMASRLFLGEQRSSAMSAHPRDPVVASWFGGGASTASGVTVTAETAMQLSAVYACVRILSSSLAMLPLKPYRNIKAGGREVAEEHELYQLLRWQPNSWQTSFEWREMLQGHLLLRGNAYCYKEYDGGGKLRALKPLHPDRTEPFWAPNGDIAYAHTDAQGKQHVYLQHEVFHLRGMSSDGLKGLSVINSLRETIGLSLAAEQFGATYFGNGTVVSGVLQTDKELSDAAFDRLKADWSSRHQGVSNAHNPAILEDGLKWQSLTVNPEEAQFLETRRFQVSEIARIFGLPPHMIADVSGSTSWGSGIESQGIGYVVYSLQPHLTRWEQAGKRDLLNATKDKSVYIEFSVEGLLRGDSKARAEFYKALFSMGAISQNEIRKKENMNPIDDGDRFFVPLNLVDVAAIDKPLEGELVDDEKDDQLRGFHARMLRQAVAKIASCEARALERALQASGDDAKALERRVTEFYADHNRFLCRHLEPVAGDYAPSVIKAHLSNALRSLQSVFEQSEPADGLRSLIKRWQGNEYQIGLCNNIASLALEGILNEE